MNKPELEASGGVKSSFWNRLFKHSLNRRELLKYGTAAAGLLTFTALSQRGSAPERFWQQAITHLAYPWKEENEQFIFRQEQLFVEGNPRLSHESTDKHKYGYVIVHPGYTEYMLYDYLKWMEQEGKKLNDPELREDYELMRSTANGVYGDYLKYINQMGSLIKHLDESGVLTIFAAEERDIYHPDIPRPEVRPFNSSMIIVTKNASPLFTEKLKTVDGPVNQDPELMFSLIKEAGIEEIRFAGEWSINPTGFACLGGVAENFHSRGFNIRGISGCVYPRLLPKPTDNEVLKRLYSDAVFLPEVLASNNR